VSALFTLIDAWRHVLSGGKGGSRQPNVYQCAGCHRFSKGLCALDPSCPLCPRCCPGHPTKKDEDEEDDEGGRRIPGKPIDVRFETQGQFKTGLFGGTSETSRGAER
jgi:hypothetical protein